MKYFVGLDVAMEETAICIVDDQRRVETGEADLAQNAAQSVISNAAQAVSSGVVSVAGTAAPEQPVSALK